MLGPLEVRCGTETLRLGGPKQRSLLAVLLLHANEVVSSDRLLEELWGDAPPEDPQALHAHVSRLRKLLEPDRNGGEPQTLLTRPPGYVVRVDPDQLDLLRFERLVEEGRAALDEGRGSDAAALLREALGLWRGRPLADLEDEPFRRDAVQRLDGAWLDALEARVQADLQCGRHDALVGELRTLVRRHPFRERLRGQLMLALYRSGRQAEALEVYTEGRRTMSEELGLEPGPALRRLQEQILEQSPELDLPAAGARSAAAGRRSRAPLLLAGALAFVAVLVGGGLLLARDDDEGAGASPGPGGVVLVDATSGEIRQRIALGSAPSAVSIGEGAAWLVDADEQTVSRVDLRSREIATFGVGSTPTDVTAGAGAVWVGSGGRSAGAQFIGAVATRVFRVDPAARTVRARIALPAPRRAVSPHKTQTVAVERDAVWAIGPDGALARIDPRTNRVVAVIRGVQGLAVAAGPVGVWLLGEDATIARIDRRRNVIAQRARIAASTVGSLALGGGSAWVTAPGDGTLWRVQPGPRLVMRTIDVGAGAGDVAVGAGGVWVANPLRGSVVRVDPASNRVARTILVGGTPRSVAVTGNAVWVATAGEARALATSAGSATLPRSTCGPVLTEGGKPDRLIVSDLPLQGGIRVSAQQMEQAIVFTLRERGFRAGRFRLGFQSCDDSIAKTGLFDEAKCAANARAYGRTRSVVGVVGYLNSFCAVAALPELNRAPGGPLAAVGALTTYVGLTRQAPGSPPGELKKLYPTGVRNFVRVVPADDHQITALAKLAAELGARRVAVVDDRDPMLGVPYADRFEETARAAGLTVAVRASFDPQGRSYSRVAERVAAARPDAVFVGSYLDNGGARAVRSIGARLRRSVRFLVADGFTPTGAFREQAGVAAEGAFVSVSGLIPETLARVGRRFLQRFRATQPGVEIEPSALYAALATEVMIDAIARSDGTREGVRRALFATRRRDSLLGAVAFDRNGDIRAAPVTVLRVKRGARQLEDFSDAVLDRVAR